jgi:hypothetical protein
VLDQVRRCGCECIPPNSLHSGTAGSKEIVLRCSAYQPLVIAEGNKAQRQRQLLLRTRASQDQYESHERGKQADKNNHDKPYVRAFACSVWDKSATKAADSDDGANDIPAHTASRYQQDCSSPGLVEIRWKKRSTGEGSACALDRQNSGGECQARTSERRRKLGDDFSSPLLSGPAVVGLSESAHVQDLGCNLPVPESLASKPSDMQL